MSLNMPLFVARLLAVLLLPACASLPGQDQTGLRISRSDPLATDPKATDALRASRFSEEVAMGADCSAGAITDAPLEDMACNGNLPDHFASFLRSIPQQHPLLSEHEREQLSRSRHSFKAVRGVGARHDILAVIHHYSPFWIRSFEGSDPDVTVYLVYGPECEALPPGDGASRKTKCRPASAYSRDFTLYRVDRSGMPRDVTSEIAPPAPRLGGGDRRRYGRYLRKTGEATDGDIKMDVSRLVYVPVLRWVLRPVQEGEYTPPDMPSSDPRAFKDYYWGNGSVAHFGFLVWDGKRMELHRTVPAALWPCRSSSPPTCDQGYDGSADRYLD